MLGRNKTVTETTPKEPSLTISRLVRAHRISVVPVADSSPEPRSYAPRVRLRGWSNTRPSPHFLQPHTTAGRLM